MAPAAATTGGKTRRMARWRGMRLATWVLLAVIYFTSIHATVTMAQDLDMDAILAASPAPSPTAGGNATGFNFASILVFSVLSVCLSSSFLLGSEHHHK